MENWKVPFAMILIIKLLPMQMLIRMLMLELYRNEYNVEAIPLSFYNRENARRHAL